MMRWSLLPLAALLASTALAQPCGPAPAEQRLDIPYALRVGSPVGLTSLDLYLPARADRCRAVPALIWVHGGGWRGGDKRNDIRDKVEWATGAGVAFVSVNYRLSPDPPRPDDPTRVKWPDHPTDVAEAIAFVRAHAAEMGIDPARLGLMGHSAGAHLVADVATDPAFLAAHGLSLDAIRCTASLDTQAYDLLALDAASDVEGPSVYDNAFGTDPEVLRQASPLAHVAAGQGIQPMLVVYRGEAVRRSIELGFAGALEVAGIETTLLDASALSHGQVSDRIGAPGDTVMTPALSRFFAGCLAR